MIIAREIFPQDARTKIHPTKVSMRHLANVAIDMSMPQPVDTSQEPPPVITPPVPPIVVVNPAPPTGPAVNPWSVNPWSVRPAAAEQSYPSVTYVSTRAMGLRAELGTLRYFPWSSLCGVVAASMWPILIIIANGAGDPLRLTGYILLAFLGSAVFIALVAAALFLSRYPNSRSTRQFTYTMTPYGMQGRGPNGTTYNAWKSLRWARRYGDDLFFSYGINVKQYVPVEAFRDGASAERFMRAALDLKSSNGNFATIAPEVLAEFTAPPKQPV